MVNPNEANAVQASLSRAAGPTVCKTTRLEVRLVGGICVGTDIDHLDDTLLDICLLPHRHIRGTAFFHVAMMAHVAELAVIGPIPTHWSLDGEFVLEHQVSLLDNAGEALELFRHTGADHDLPVHG